MNEWTENQKFRLTGPPKYPYGAAGPFSIYEIGVPSGDAIHTGFSVRIHAFKFIVLF